MVNKLFPDPFLKNQNLALSREIYFWQFIVNFESVCKNIP